MDICVRPHRQFRRTAERLQRIPDTTQMTARQRKVIGLLRNERNCTVQAMLQISRQRISQIVRQVEKRAQREGDRVCL